MSQVFRDAEHIPTNLLNDAQIACYHAQLKSINGFMNVNGTIIWKGCHEYEEPGLLKNYKYSSYIDLIRSCNHSKGI
jgi:hypothetical protein